MLVYSEATATTHKNSRCEYAHSRFALFNLPVLTSCAVVTSLPLHYCSNIRAVKLLHIPCRHAGWRELWLYTFLDFTLTGTEWSASCLSFFTHSSLWLGWWWVLELVWTFWRKENLLCLSEFEVLPVAWSLYWVCCSAVALLGGEVGATVFGLVLRLHFMIDCWAIPNLHHVGWELLH